MKDIVRCDEQGRKRSKGRSKKEISKNASQERKEMKGLKTEDKVKKKKEVRSRRKERSG